MLPRVVRSLLVVIGLSLASTVLTGCFLQNVFSQIHVSSISEEVSEILTSVKGNATVAVCDHIGVFYNCVYIVDGTPITSTAAIFSEFGLAGIIIDPVVVQIPGNAISITAQYSTTAGYQPAVTSVRNSFPVKPGVNITAEAGTQFVILELPNSVTSGLTQTNPANGLPVSYAISFTQQQPVTQTVEPVNIKAMFTGRIVANGHVYYAPLLPCTTNFANIPSLTIPVTDTLVNLQPSIGALLGQVAPCNHATYDYTFAPPPEHRMYLPLMRK